MDLRHLKQISAWKSFIRSLYIIAGVFKFKSMRVILISITALIFLQSCTDDSPTHIQYAKGDFWVKDFRTNSYPSKAFKDDKIYCSSLVIGGDSSNYLYCLNLLTGKVDWASKVKSWATFAPIVCDSFIYYCGYLGNIYRFDKNGNQIWYKQLDGSYAGHCLNTFNNNLIVKTVDNGLSEFDAATGKVVDSVGKGRMRVSLPVFLNDTVFQTGVRDTITCTKASTNKIIWKIKTGTNVSRLFIAQNRLYYFDDSQSLHCINVENGNQFWQSEKIFDRDPLSPHLLVENGKIFCYFTSLTNILVLDLENGKLLEHTSLENLQKQNYLLPVTKDYKVADANKILYTITVENSFDGASDFRNSYDILIKKK
jgi:outer membrane protein assembly factor BamB